MSRIIEFDTVRVVALHGSPESHLAITGCSRPPALGDVGTVVHLNPTWDPDDPETRFIVESDEGPGNSVWLAEFSPDELEFVSRPNQAHEPASASSSILADAYDETIESLRNQWLSTMPTHDIHRKYVEEHRVLPLASGMGGFYGLTAAGEIVEFGWDADEREKPIIDPRLRNLALFQGAEKYPLLRGLLPERPSDAQTCRSCNGTGKVTELPDHLRTKIVCYCGGAGWLPAGTAQLREEIDQKGRKRWWEFWRR